MSKVNLKHNILMSGSFRIIVLVISFVTSVFSTRYLGVELKGKLSYLITISGFVWMVLDLGLYRSFPYLVRKFPDKVSSLFYWILLQFFINLAVLTVLGLSLLQFFSGVIGYAFSPVYMILFVCLITFAQLATQLQSLYLGLNKIWKHSLAQLLNALIMLTLVLTGYAFLRQSDRLAYIIIATILSYTILIIYYTVNHNWKQPDNKLDLSFIKSAYKSGIRVFLSTLFILMLIRFDIVLVKRLLGYSEVGIYSLAAHLIDMLQIASNVVGGLLLVKLSDSTDDIEKWIIMKKLLMSFFALLLIANAGFAILGKFIIGALYGTQFIPVYFVYLWLIPASFGLSFGSLFNMYLNSKGFPVISIILPAIALLVNILLNLLLIPLWGIYGAALATSIAYLLWFIMILGYEQKCSQGKMFRHLVPHRQDWVLLWQEGQYYLLASWSRLFRQEKK
ncbi:MAG: oligosaccharide flippase family protein [Candidatus Cloacimonadaceae bacterium]